MEQVTGEEVLQVPKNIFLKELPSIATKHGEICKAPRSAHDFPIVTLVKEEQEQELKLEPLSPKVFRFAETKMHLFNSISECKNENDYVILYATDNEEEVTLFFKNTNSEGDQFKVHLYPIRTETKIRFFFANSSNVFQTDWIFSKPRPVKIIERKPQSDNNLEQLSVEQDKGETPKVKFGGCRWPLWVLVSVFAAIPIIVVAVSVTSILYTQGQGQVDDMYRDLKEQIHVDILDNLDKYLGDMKLIANVVQQLDEQIFTNTVPSSNFSTDVLIHLMNLYSETQNVESLGFIMKANGTANGKLNFEVAKGASFGCPEYIYALCDESIYPSFLGICAYKNLTVSSRVLYNATDWGLTPLQAELLSGQVSQTFLPIFPLVSYFTFTYAVAVKSRANPNDVYGFSFAQRSLQLVDNFLKTLHVGKSGILYIIENDSGLLVSSSIENQTTETVNSQVVRVKATEAKNSMIKASAQFLESEIGFSDYSGSVNYTQDIDGENMLIDAIRYKDTGMDWTIVIVVPYSDFFGRIEDSTGISLGVSAAIGVAALLSTFFWSRFVVRPLSAVKRNMARLALLEFTDLEPTLESNIAEFREIQESYSNLEKELAKKRKSIHINKSENEIASTV